jgi:hypothetical protein
MSNDDLVELNTRMARFALGDVSEALSKYILLTSICIGELIPGTGELLAFLGASHPAKENPIDVIRLNQDYLSFARLLGKDVAAGRIEELMVLRVDYRQAELLASLTNSQIHALACYWPGPIIRIRAEDLRRVSEVHPSAMPFCASALAATVGRPAHPV